MAPLSFSGIRLVPIHQFNKFNMIGQIYKTIQYFVRERIPEIKHISLYNRQFDVPRDNRAFDYPALLIEIDTIPFQNQLSQVQYAQVGIKLHIGTEIYAGFDSGDSMQDSSFEHLKILDKVFIGLNRVNSKELPAEMQDPMYPQSSLRRDSIRLLTGDGVVHHSIINCSFIITDLSAMKKYTEYELSDITLNSYYKPSPPFNGEEEKITTSLTA